jgi:hypothetical protein
MGFITGALLLALSFQKDRNQRSIATSTTSSWRNTLIAYGKDKQATTPGDTSPLLDAAGKRHIQQIVGSFLYYA